MSKRNGLQKQRRLMEWGDTGKWEIRVSREASQCMLVPYSSAAHYRAERIDTIQTKTKNLTRGYYI